jgi:hypothetical protein
VYFDKCPQRPVPEYDKGRKRWRLVARTFTRPSDRKAKRKNVGQFDTKDAAQEEVQYWWAVLRGVAGSPPMKPATLNASKRSQQIAFNVLIGVKRVSRAEFKSLMVNPTAGGMERYMRLMRRCYDDMQVCSKAWRLRMNQMRFYLNGIITQFKDVLRGIKFAMMGGNVTKYILGEHGDVDIGYSVKQVARIHQQINVVFQVMLKLQCRCKRELQILRRAAGATTDEQLEVFKQERATLLQVHSTPAIAYRVAESAEGAVHVSTLLAWFRDFRRYDYKGFPADGRGKWEPSCFLDAINLPRVGWLPECPLCWVPFCIKVRTTLTSPSKPTFCNL